LSRLFCLHCPTMEVCRLPGCGNLRHHRSEFCSLECVELGQLREANRIKAEEADRIKAEEADRIKAEKEGRIPKPLAQLSTMEFNSCLDKFEAHILKKVRADLAIELTVEKALERERASQQEEIAAMKLDSSKLSEAIEARFTRLLKQQEETMGMGQKLSELSQSIEVRFANLDQERTSDQKDTATKLSELSQSIELRSAELLEQHQAAIDQKLSEFSHALNARIPADDAEAKKAIRGREVRADGVSFVTKSAVESLDLAEAAVAEKQNNLDQVRQLVAKKLPNMEAVEQHAASEMQSALDEATRLRAQVDKERKADAAARDCGGSDERLASLEVEIAVLRKIVETPSLPPRAAATAMTSGSGRLNTDEDVVDIQYRPIMDFVRNVSPTMGVKATLRTEVVQVQEFKNLFAPFMESFLQEVQRIAHSIRNCLQSQKIHEDVDDEELLAVAIFTAELQSFAVSARPENEFYRIYGGCLRGRQALQMRLLGNFSFYLFRGIGKMPVAQGTLWRGLRGKKVVAQALRRYSTKFLEVCFNAFSSASFSRDVAKNFATQPEEEKLTEAELAEIPEGTPSSLILKFEIVKCAHDISDISAVPSEREGTILPGSAFLIMATAHSASDGVLEVHLAERPSEKAIQS